MGLYPSPRLARPNPRYNGLSNPILCGYLGLPSSAISDKANLFCCQFGGVMFIAVLCAPFFAHVFIVVIPGPDEQVVWIHASPDVTPMANNKSVRNRANEQFIGDTVRPYLPAARKQDSVSGVIDSAGPKPASGCALPDPEEQPIPQSRFDRKRVILKPARLPGALVVLATEAAPNGCAIAKYAFHG
jgi:hypothetical protein